jgi:hypothetical protein
VTRGLWGGENSNLGPTDYESVIERLDYLRPLCEIGRLPAVATYHTIALHRVIFRSLAVQARYWPVTDRHCFERHIGG